MVRHFGRYPECSAMKSFALGAITGIALFLACLTGPPEWRSIPFDPALFIFSRFTPPFEMRRYDKCPTTISLSRRQQKGAPLLALEGDSPPQNGWY